MANDDIKAAITLAVLGEKVDNTNRKLDEVIDGLRILNGTVRADNDRITRIEERQGPIARTQAAINAGFTLICATAAAWWGSRP